MNKTYISPTKIACLAICCVIPTISYGFNAIILAICVAAAFLFSIAIVSMFENISNSHVRFVTYAIILTAILTILKLVFTYAGSLRFIEVAMQLDYGVLAGLVLGIYPVYYLHKTTSKTYFLSALITAITFVLYLALIAIIIELLTYGTILGLVSFNFSLMFMGSSFMIYLLLSLLCVIGVSIEIYVANRRREARLLIDKYKYMIRENQMEKLKLQNDNFKNQDLSVGGDRDGH